MLAKAISSMGRNLTWRASLLGLDVPSSAHFGTYIRRTYGVNFFALAFGGWKSYRSTFGVNFFALAFGGWIFALAFGGWKSYS